MTYTEFVMTTFFVGLLGVILLRLFDYRLSRSKRELSWGLVLLVVVVQILSRVFYGKITSTIDLVGSFIVMLLFLIILIRQFVLAYQFSGQKKDNPIQPPQATWKNQ